MRMERQIQLFKRLLNKWCLQLSGRASDRKSGDRGSTPRRRTTIFQNYILYDLTAWVSLNCSSVPVLGSWVWGSCGPAQEKRSNISFFQNINLQVSLCLLFGGLLSKNIFHIHTILKKPLESVTDPKSDYNKRHEELGRIFKIHSKINTHPKYPPLKNR